MPNSELPFYNAANPDPKSREDHQREAFQAFEGADQALNSLLNAMNLGPNGLRKHAYATKARVKGVDSAVRKVMEKRLTKTTDYSVANITDVIGVRILCLFSDDLWDTVRWLLEFVELQSSRADGMFADGGLKDCVKEVIVYHPKTATSDVYEGCYRQIKGRFGNTFSNLKFEDPGGDKSYSSIHVVAFLKYYGAERTITFPIEFQIRTALEDVWAEMDHKLFYKRATLDDGAVDLARQMLTNQKIHLDAISTTTDKIRATCKTSDRDPDADKYIRAMGVDVSLSRAGVDKAKRQIRDAFSKLQEQMREAYQRIEHRVTMRGEGIAFQADDYDRFCELERQIGDFAAVSEIGHDIDLEKRHYFLQMELALSHVWRALISSSIINQKGGAARDWKRRLKDHTNLAARIYQDLAQKPAYESDAFVWFRLGWVQIHLKNDAKAGAASLERSTTFLDSDEDIPGNSQFRVTIPGIYGFAIWTEVADIFRNGAPSEVAPHVHEALLKAFRTTYGLERLPVQDAAIRSGVRIIDEKRKAVNNWLSYALFYLLSGGSWQELEKLGLNETMFRSTLSDFAATPDIDLDAEPWALHTLTLGYRFLGDKLSKEYAARLDAALEAGCARERDDILWIDRMRADAESAMSD